MFIRLKNTLVTLVMLLICGASNQGLACEIACGLQAQHATCHSTTQTSGADQSDQMDMSDCAQMAMPPAPQTDLIPGSCHDGSCIHPSTWAFQKSGAPDTHSAATYQTVIYVAPADFNFSIRGLIATKSPPFRLASVDPLVLSLRV